MLSGSSKPCSRAAACAFASTTPASAVIVKPTASTSRTRFKRVSERRIWPLAVERRGAAAVARIAALRHHAEPRVVAHAHDGRHLLHRGRPNDERRGATVQPAFVTQQRRGVGAREHARGAHDAGDLCDCSGVVRHVHPWPPASYHRHSTPRTEPRCHTPAPHRLLGNGNPLHAAGARVANRGAREPACARAPRAR